MNTVFIQGLEVLAVIGVHPHERVAPQTLQLDLEIELASARACRTDRLEDTIDYAQVVKRVREELALRQFALVEAAAGHVAQLILGEFAAARARVSVAKVGFMTGVARLGATVERRAFLARARQMPPAPAEVALVVGDAEQIDVPVPIWARRA